MLGLLDSVFVSRDCCASLCTTECFYKCGQYKPHELFCECETRIRSPDNRVRRVLLAWCLRTTRSSRENWKDDMPQWPMQGVHCGKVNTQNIEITLSKVGQCKGSAGSTALHRCEMYRAWRSSSSSYCCSNDCYTSAPHVICPHDIICDKRLRRACNNLQPVLFVHFKPDLPTFE